MPYRSPGRAPSRTPVSPDLDEDLLAMPASSKLLLSSVVSTPFVLWVVWMIDSGEGPRQLPVQVKVAFTVAVALWNAVLLVARARHDARMRAVLAMLREDVVTDSTRLRVASAEEAPLATDNAPITPRERKGWR